MRKRTILSIALLGLLGGGPAAHAATLPVTGTLSFDFGGRFTAPVLTGSGLGISAGGPGSLATIPAGLFHRTTPFSLFLSPPAFTDFAVPGDPFPGFSLITAQASPTAPIANGAGVFSPSGAMSNNAMVRIFFAGNGALLGQIPLGFVGGGGGALAPATFIGLPVYGHPVIWTNLGLGPAGGTVTQTAMFIVLGAPVEWRATAIDNRTAGGLGTLQLVAPTIVTVQQFGELPIVGTLRLVYTPEPGALVLVAAGLAGLVAARRMPRTRGR